MEKSAPPAEKPAVALVEGTEPSHGKNRPGGLRHRFEMAMLAFHVFSIPLTLSTFMLVCSFPLFWPVVLVYLIHMLFDNSPSNGAIMPYAPSFRKSRLWKLFATYFPITLHKTADLEPCFVSGPASKQPPAEPPFIWKLTFWWYYYLLRPQSEPSVVPTGKKYVFGYHPHGIIGMGVIGGIASDGAGWSRAFPGIPIRVLTLEQQFRLPLYREYLLSLGMAAVSRKSCQALLANNQPICIVIGGAQESLLAIPGVMDLVLKKRLGFVRLAMQAGGDTSLVPVLAFGENDLYNQVQSSSWLHTIQTKLKNTVGFTLPLMHARGVFNYEMGIIPYRRAIDIVVGNPIPVPHIQQPSTEELEHYQQLYIDELERLFEENKAKFYKSWNPDQTVDDFKLRLVA